VSGAVNEEGRVLGASTDGKCHTVSCSFQTAHWREWGPVPFGYQFENTGNTHVQAAGEITVTDSFGRLAGSVKVEPKTVLPGSSRTFEAIWPREVLFGHYTAKLEVTYGEQRRTQTAQVSFWVIPWRALVVFGGLILSLGLAIWVIHRRHQQKRLT
jgi:hypothetical protein